MLKRDGTRITSGLEGYASVFIKVRTLRGKDVEERVVEVEKL